MSKINPSKENLANNLKYYRYKLDLSQEKYAELLGTSLRYISHLELMKRNPSLQLLDRFSAQLRKIFKDNSITSANLISYHPERTIYKKRVDEKSNN